MDRSIKGTARKFHMCTDRADWDRRIALAIMQGKDVRLAHLKNDFFECDGVRIFAPFKLNMDHLANVLEELAKINRHSQTTDVPVRLTHRGYRFRCG